MSYYQVPRFCGVYYLPLPVGAFVTPSWLPQVALSTNSRLNDTASSTVLTQTFVNPSKVTPIETAKYNFPLYESCAVVSFRCFVGKRLINGVVKEKEEAKVMYKEAVVRGDTAGLLEQQTPDVFSTSLGNIPAGETVKIEIEYIMELKHDAEVDALRFTIPTSIAPRYGQAPSGLDTFSDGKPIPGALESGMKISVKLTMPSNIQAVQSPSHTIAMHLGGHVEDISDDKFNPKHALATLSQTSTELGADFVLLVKCADLSSPRALLETHSTLPNSKALMVTLVPKFTLPPGPKPEIVFIVDRSGSMASRMIALRSALSVFLRSLPVGVKFNICSFGTTYSFLWKKSQPYSANTLNEAQKHVESMDSNFGGTEIFKPVKATVEQRFKDIPLEMMVLTDGQVWNLTELFTYLEDKTAKGDVRLFSMGIGKEVSHSLVEGMARAGRGFSQIVLDETEGIEGKVVRMLRAGLSVHINDYRLEWDARPPEQVVSSKEKSAVVRGKKISLYDSKADADAPISPKSGTGRYAHLPDFVVPAVLQAPYKLPSLFPFSRSTVYVILSGDVPTPSSVWLRGTTPSGDELELEIVVQVVSERAYTIHQLAARKILQELEEGNGYLHSGKYGIDPKENAGTFDEWVAREGTRVGITYKLASKWTSFVAVEKTGKVATVTEKSIDVDEMLIDSDSEDVDGDNEEKGYQIIDSGDKCENVPTGQPVYISHLGSFGSSGHGNLGGRGGLPSRKKVMAGGGTLEPIGGGAKSTSALVNTNGLKKMFSLGRPRKRSVAVFGSAPPSATSSPTDRVSEEYSAPSFTSREQAKALIVLQTFDGSFQLTAALAAILDIKLTDLKAKLMEFVPVGACLKEEQKLQLWATVLVVVMFERKLKDEKEMWELVVEKARGWVEQSAVREDVRRFEVLAGEVLGI